MSEQWQALNAAMGNWSSTRTREDVEGNPQELVRQAFCAAWAGGRDWQREQDAARLAALERALGDATACADLLVRLVRPMYSGPSGDQGLNDPLYGECQQAIKRYKASRAALAASAALAGAEVYSPEYDHAVIFESTMTVDVSDDDEPGAGGVG